MDKFHAEIGIATLKLAVSGRVETLRPFRRMIEVEKLGVYLRDSYDFFGTAMILKMTGGFLSRWVCGGRQTELRQSLTPVRWWRR